MQTAWDTLGGVPSCGLLLSILFTPAYLSTPCLQACQLSLFVLVTSEKDGIIPRLQNPDMKREMKRKM